MIEASTPCSAPFDGDDWLFNVDWEGSRCLLIADADGSIRLQGENAALDERFPEIVAAGRFLAGRAAVLDGSICVLDAQGRPDLAALSRRAITGQALPPAVYLVTDVLHLDGEPMSARPLLARLAALAELIPRDSRIQLPDHVVGHGRALADAATERGLAAVLARRQDAQYLAGMASPLRLRVALSGRRDAVVVGWRSSGSGPAPAARRLGARPARADRRGSAGRRGRAPLAGRRPPRLYPPSPSTTRTRPAPGSPGSGPGWSPPSSPATGTRRRGLPGWRLVALRDDVDPMWCVRRPPVDAAAGQRAPAPAPLQPDRPQRLADLSGSLARRGLPYAPRGLRGG